MGYGLKDAVVAVVVNAVSQGHIDTVILAFSIANVANIPGAGKVLSVLVEGDGHDPIGRVKGLLHPVPVVNVNVNVQDARMIFQQLQDGQVNVVDVAKTGSFAPLGVM